MMKIRSIVLALLLLVPMLVFAKGKREVWVIDAGHGGRDVGCEGSKAKEKDITLKVALRVVELVRANIGGVKVMMTRDRDKFVSLEERANFANRNKADLFVSIHVNSAPEAPYVRGTETYYGPLGGTSNVILEADRKRNIRKSELMAWQMQKYYGLAGRPISRGVKRERYYVILYTRMPSILTEVGFISTASEQAYMMSKAGQEEMAQCIYKGLKEYKKVVDAGNEKRVLAEMRRTNARNFLSSNKTVASDLVGTDLATTQTTAEAIEGNRNQLAMNETTPESSAKEETSVNVSTSKGSKTSATSKDKVAKVVEEEPDPMLEPALDNEALSFSVQILSCREKLKPTDARLKGLKHITTLPREGGYKYLYGTTDDYATARKTLLEVRKVFPDAFLVAYLGKRQISTADAQEMYIHKK